MQGEKDREVAKWLETWTEINAIPGTLPEDESPCTDALNFTKDCIVAARSEGYTEEDLRNSQVANGNLEMYFDRAVRRNFRIDPGR